MDILIDGKWIYEVLVTLGQLSSHCPLSPSLDFALVLGWHQAMRYPSRHFPTSALSTGSPRTTHGEDSGGLSGSLWTLAEDKQMCCASEGLWSGCVDCRVLSYRHAVSPAYPRGRTQGLGPYLFAKTIPNPLGKNKKRERMKGELESSWEQETNRGWRKLGAISDWSWQRVVLGN